MSYQFTSDELADLRTAQTGHMLDTGNMMPVTVTQDSFGQMVETWTTNGADVACGLDMRPGSERHGTDMTVVAYDATVRLAITTSVDLRDRFRVTKRFGETLSSALIFDIVSPIQRGPSGIRLMLRRVEV